MALRRESSDVARELLQSISSGKRLGDLDIAVSTSSRGGALSADTCTAENGVSPGKVCASHVSELDIPFLLSKP